MMKSLVIFIVLIMTFSLSVVAQKDVLMGRIGFKNGSEALLVDYKNNATQLQQIQKVLKLNEDVILTIDGHIRLVSYIPSSKKNDLLAINMAALRASVIRGYLKKKFRMLTNWSFTFHVDANGESGNYVDVVYVKTPIPYNQSSDIHYSTDKTNITSVKSVLSRYKEIPFIVKGDENDNSKTYDSIIRTARIKKIEASQEMSYSSDEIKIVIYFRWDKSNLDTLYLNNTEHLRRLDSLLDLSSVRHIDSLRIVSYASPEGHPDYNKRLSERRGETIKKYIIEKHPYIPLEHIYVEPRGENWEGVRLFVNSDMNLPKRDEVIKILNAPLSDIERQRLLTKLDGGRVYYRYILPNYYKYLRNGASVFIVYNNTAKLFIDKIPIRKTIIAIPPISDTLRPIVSRELMKYPFAIRTNLLYDMVGAADIGLEFPIGNNWSLMADFTYGYWRAASNLYALQVLMGGVECRYWFNVSEKRKDKNIEWTKPLRGWNVGVYGMYSPRYDVQWIDGYQGDGFWSAGLTVGYATPIARNLSLEFSLGGGCFYTPEYRHYHRPEYDTDGNYRLMWQETGSFGGFSLTKTRVSLVWLIGKKAKH